MPGGAEHYKHAEEMADEAAERLQHMDWEAAVAWAAVAQVFHATLANAAANAVGAHTSLEILAWRGAAAH